jgi:hypothetical protein
MKHCIAMILLAASLSWSQTASPQKPARIVTTTRLVAIFSELENQLINAIQKKDQTTLDRLLTEDFQVWKPMSDPVPKDDWIKEAELQKLASFRIAHMAVRALNEQTSIASFVLIPTAGQSREQYFVVDVWQKTADTWQLTDRYVSGTKVVATQPPADRKPTGRN